MKKLSRGRRDEKGGKRHQEETEDRGQSISVIREIAPRGEKKTGGPKREEGGKGTMSVGSKLTGERSGRDGTSKK